MSENSDSGYDPLDYDALGSRLPPHVRRWRDDPNHWFNDQEDNRFWVEDDRQMMAGRPATDLWEEVRRMEEAGRTTVTIGGKEYPAATTADLLRMSQAAELRRARERGQTEPSP